LILQKQDNYIILYFHASN